MSDNNRLYLHCGGTGANFSDVCSIETPAPTATHYPIPHETLLNTVDNRLQTHGLTITDRHYGLNHEGNDLFALYNIERQDEEGNGTFQNVVGIRNSHIKHFSAGLVAGSRVFVCDNLAFTGEVKMNRKHTRHILRDLSNLIGHMVLQVCDKWNYQEIRYEAYADTVLNNAQAHDLIMWSMRNGALPSSKLEAVVKEWDTPSHEAFEPRNCWSLFNAFTEVQKSSPSMLTDRSIRLHDTFTDYCKDAIEVRMDSTNEYEEAVAEAVDFELV
jgi:hypothetical protein